MSKEKIDQILRSIEVPEILTDDQAWESIQNKLSQNHRVSERRIVPAWLYAAAAAVVTGIGLFIFMNNKPTEVSAFTSQGEVRTISLPDGSVLHLFAGSSAKFSSEWSNERDVQLDGDGFFEVVKGSKFTVHCKQGDVSVLGTSFSVTSREKRFNVHCLTGKVKVSSGGTDEIITPGEGVRLQNGQLKRSSIFVDRSDLNTGILVFEEEPLNLVFDELERVYKIEIDHPDILGRPFSGELTGMKPDQSLDVIAATMGLKIVKTAEDRFIVSTP